jgi:hypothetical protein
MEIFGINFNPFSSAHGGERDAQGNITERGKKDFFAPFLDFSESIDSWKKFAKGDISWRDFVDPGSVINNPLQKIADPGEFFTGNKLTEGDFGKRGRASAALAALSYLGMGAPGLASAGTMITGSGAAAGGVAGEGGAASLTPVASSSASNLGFANAIEANALTEAGSAGGASTFGSKLSGLMQNQDLLGMFKNIGGNMAGVDQGGGTSGSVQSNYSQISKMLAELLKRKDKETKSELGSL